MKPLLQSRTPTQLLWLVAAANALVVIGFGVLRYRSLHLLLWCSFAAVVFGLVSSLVVEQTLRNGISSDRWPEKLLEAPGKFIASGFPILCGLLILGSLANVVFSPHQVGGTWMFFAPLLTLTRVATCLRPKPASDRLFQPRVQSKPLQSENWGSPPRPFSS
jgi:TRAP-type C4-dicarboxylate transport system permease small subunit